VEAARCPGEEEEEEGGAGLSEREYIGICFAFFLVFSVVVFYLLFVFLEVFMSAFCLNFYLYSAPAPPYCGVQFFVLIIIR